MRIHHLNCVSGCPLGGLLMDGLSGSRLRGRLTSHCLLLEGESSLALVDTGYGLRDVAAPRSRLSPFFLALVKPELREEMTAVRQIERLGFNPHDVRHIVLSHLDFDHAGGLDDFPHARVHLLTSEIDAALAQRTLLDRMRYRPQQWHTRDMWRGYATEGGENWLGFSGAQAVDGLGSDVLLVPLMGHTLGHAGIAVRRETGWLLYAADAYFYHRELDRDRSRCTPGLRLYQTMMEKNRELRLHNRERLRKLRHERDDVSVFCAHDVREFEQLSGRPFHALPPAASSSLRSAGTPHPSELLTPARAE
jgi:glyoxylase-like metal-dependent hydrolase (beta-lactamase superfamily II)